MNLNQLPRLLMLLAALGLVVILGARVIERVGGKASSALPI